MKSEQSSPRETVQPAGYDSDGRPLYHHPPAADNSSTPTSLVNSKPEAYEGHNFNPRLRAQHANEPDLFHATRPIDPKVPVVSERIKKKHDESVRRFPFLNLSEGEFVVLRIKRHPIGLIIPATLTTLAIVIFVSFALLVPDFYSSMELASETGAMGAPSASIMVGILLLLALICLVVGGASIWIYQKNQFFLTNESVIQEIQHGLFSHHEQTVSLGSIEDASYKRRGILQHIFDYGTMRLSTEGQETTYRFEFVENPKEQIAIVSNAVEAFKNGRPVRAVQPKEVKK